MARKIHLRSASVINVNSSKTACGRSLGWPIGDTSGAVVSFHALDATVHDVLTTCKRCLATQGAL